MRLVHIADLHLDAPFARHGSAIRNQLRGASREALRRAVTLAVGRRVDAFVIAGDLFDGDTMELATERFLSEELARLQEADVTVVYATGNHDPGTANVHSGRFEWPPNVHVASGPDPIQTSIRDRDGRVVGRIAAVGHAHSRVADDLSQRFPPTDPARGVPEVAVLHTQVVGSRGSEAHDRYAPSELPALMRSGHSYWALGHVHGRQSLAESPRICYPGSPQGLSIRETGARGVLLVDVTGPDRCTTEFVEVGPIRWEVAEIRDPIEESTLNALLRRIEREWRTLREADTGADSTEWLLRLRIHGRAALAAELAREDGIETLRSEVRTALGLLDVEVITQGLVTPVAWEDHVRRPDVLGEALRLVGEFRDDPDAGWFDPSTLAGGGAAMDPAQLAAYVRSLLDGAEAHVADRLLRETPRE